MKQIAEIPPFLANENGLLPHVSIDCVIFGFHEAQLKVLVLKYKAEGLYALPGGFVQKSESLNAAANRVLEERTGLKDVYLEQFHTFGAPNRTNSNMHHEMFASLGISLPDKHWILERHISVGYYALVDFSKVTPVPDVFSELCDWYDLNTLPSLILDHGEMVQKALETLRLMLDHQLVGFNLLPETFTMSELQQLYETVLQTTYLRANFQRKMLGLNILERLEKRYAGGAHKAPYLYRFRVTNDSSDE
jgi:ADP-ribose pyrophosphatase YjhB (NUDIX family)